MVGCCLPRNAWNRVDVRDLDDALQVLECDPLGIAVGVDFALWRWLEMTRPARLAVGRLVPWSTAVGIAGAGVW